MTKPLLANYHTHTSLCKHADGTEIEYIEMAIANGFSILGFSDHLPWPRCAPDLSQFRMELDELSTHVETIRNLQKQYADKITIRLGFEVEYFPEYFDWMQEIVQKYQIEYLALGNHFNRALGDCGYYGSLTQAHQLKSYEASSIAGMESGLFAFFAHPDLYLNSYPIFDSACAQTAHAICEAAAALHIPLEYNLLGEDRRGGSFSTGLGYTRPEFWDIAAKYDIQAIVGCDAHSPKHLNHHERILAIKAMLRAKGITVLDTLDGLGV